MPSRILKESICTSESLAYLSAEAEVLFYRLIVKADDFGLYYGSPKILASLLFPLNVPTEKKVSSWLAELVNGGLVATYRAEDGRQALEADLEFILESAYPSSQLSDAGVRVQSSPDPDGRLVRMVDKRDRRRQRANEAIGNLERQLQQITEVQNLVYTLDTRSKCVLLALYYPYRSYDEAAEFLQVERTTVYRQREIALNRLFARAERSKAFRE